MQIRPFHTDDTKSILGLLGCNTSLYFAPQEKDDLVYYLANEIEDYFVLEVAAQIVGCGGINYKTPTAYLAWDIVHPDFQRKGVGRALCEFRLQKISTVPEITNICVRTSQHAFMFYEKCGFRLTEVLPDYWAKGFDLYKMYHLPYSKDETR